MIWMAFAGALEHLADRLSQVLRMISLPSSSGISNVWGSDSSPVVLSGPMSAEGGTEVLSGSCCVGRCNVAPTDFDLCSGLSSFSLTPPPFVCVSSNCSSRLVTSGASIPVELCCPQPTCRHCGSSGRENEGPAADGSSPMGGSKVWCECEDGHVVSWTSCAFLCSALECISAVEGLRDPVDRPEVVLVLTGLQSCSGCEVNSFSAGAVWGTGSGRRTGLGGSLLTTFLRGLFLLSHLTAVTRAH